MSTERDTADAQLERILYILPAACKPGGTTLSALAEALDVSIDVIRNDIEQVTAREYYHPAGSIDAFGVFLEEDRIEVSTRGEYTRPVRLNGGEALAVELGLRVLALEAPHDRRTNIGKLARRIQKEMCAPDTLPGADAPRGTDVAYDAKEEAALFLATGDDVARGIVSDAIAMQKVCTLSYLKPGERAPASRRIAPQKLIYSDGLWYTLAYDYDRKATRFFRLDRVLDVVIQDEKAEVLADLKWESAENGAPYEATDDQIVGVRYKPCIARWITERTGVQPDADGSVLVKHRVADPRWIVRHVLQYAGDAVIEDEPYQEAVRAAALRIAV